MRDRKIKTVQGLIAYVQKNSSWQAATVRHVVQALGYTAADGAHGLKSLSNQLANCARHGAAVGFPGFTYYSDTIAFYRKHRTDIAKNIEQTAAECGIDIIEFIQSFGIYRRTDKPAPQEIGKALWDNAHYHDDLTDLYNVLAWYVLEEVSNIWYRYLEDNPGYYAELSS